MKLDEFKKILKELPSEHNTTYTDEQILEAIEKVKTEEQRVSIPCFEEKLLSALDDHQKDLLSDSLSTHNLYDVNNMVYSEESNDTSGFKGSSSNISKNHGTRSKTSIESREIRGAVTTYTQSMMGGFEYEYKDNSFYIKDDAKIIRPHSITGNLGSHLGAHVIPFAVILDRINKLVRGKEVFEAIKILQSNLAVQQNNDRQALIDSAKPHLKQKDNSEMETKWSAASFLRSEFIPSIVALHNQNIGTAFHANKSKKELGEEANIVKKFMNSDLNGASLEQLIDEFISVVDYRPVTNSSTLESSESIEKGIRTNHIEGLSTIIGNVTESFLDMYSIDLTSESLSPIDIFVSKIINKNGWVDHFKENKQDLGNAFKGEITEEYISEYVTKKIKSANPVLFDIESFKDSSRSSTINATDSFEFISNIDVRKRTRSDLSSTEASEQEEGPSSNDKSNSDHLARSEKSIITKTTKPKFIDILCEDLTEEQKVMISQMKNKLPSSQTSKLDRDPHADNHHSLSKVTLMAEDSHQTDHRGNVERLSDMIEKGQLSSNAVICLERKEFGNNFGMNDVRLLAGILEHNKNNQHDAISIPEKIHKSLIYKDAMLYNIAKSVGIEVVGIEGKGLTHNKDSPLYNETREDHIVKNIEQIISSGKEVIFPVGSSHIDRISSTLGTKSVNVLIDLDVSKANDKKRNYDIILKDAGFRAPTTTTAVEDNSSSIAIRNPILNKVQSTKGPGLN